VNTLESTGATIVDMQLFTSRWKYRINNNIPSLASQTWVICVVARMDANDTATYTIKLTGIGADTADIAGSTPLLTYVSGHLLA
jgi:hypothetical protein